MVIGTSNKLASMLIPLYMVMRRTFFLALIVLSLPLFKYFFIYEKSIIDMIIVSTHLLPNAF